MKKNLYYALKDVKRNLISIIIFIFLSIIFIFYIYFSVYQLQKNQQFGYYIKKLSDYNFVNFNVYYKDNEMVKPSPEIIQMLTEVLDNKQQGFTVIDDLELPEDPDLNIVIGLGRFGEIFELNANKKSTDTRVLIGSKMEDLHVGDTIQFGMNQGEKLVINDQLPINSSYLNKQFSVSLDNSIVILTTFENFYKNYPAYHIDRIIGNVSLLNPSDDEINKFVEIISENSNFYVSPYLFNKTAPAIHRETMMNSLFFLLFFLFTIIFISVSIISSLLLLIDDHLQEYAIHRIYGATQIDLFWRTIIFILFIIVFPLFFAFILTRMIAPEQLSPFNIILIGIIVIISLSYFPIRKLKMHDMTFYLRRDY